MTHPSLNGAQFGSGGLGQYNGTIGASGTAGMAMAQAVVLKPKIVTRFADFQPGKMFRIAEIDKKLQKLCDKTAQHQDMYRHLPHEIGVEVLGNYNPIYAGRPKKLAMALLNRMEIGKGSNYALYLAGLMYRVPGLIGIRGERERTSSAGVELMMHWCQKFPAFKRFYDAYVTDKAKEAIYSECFDLIMNVRPASFVKIDKANVQNQIKFEAREYRRIKKEEAAEALRKKTIAQQKAINDSQAYQRMFAEQQYRNAMQQSAKPMIPRITSGPIWTTNDTSVVVNSVSVVTPKGILANLKKVLDV